MSIRVNEEEKKYLIKLQNYMVLVFLLLLNKLYLKNLKMNLILALAKNSYKEYLKDKKSYTMEEVAEILGIE